VKSQQIQIKINSVATRNAEAMKKILRPILCYACPIFENLAKVHIKKLQVTQNKIIKLILQAPWRTSTTLIHQVANIEPVQEFFTKITDKFFVGFLNSNDAGKNRFENCIHTAIIIASSIKIFDFQLTYLMK
jgi:hypothetical protein